MPTIIGIEKTIDDPGTGAQATYHVVVQYLVQLFNGGGSAVTLAGYVSRAAHESGKNPLMHSTAQLKVRPAGDCEAWLDWFCQQIMANAAPGDALEGATPVYGDDVPGAEA